MKIQRWKIQKTIHSLFSKHTFEAIAIGDGTAGRDWEVY